MGLILQLASRMASNVLICTLFRARVINHTIVLPWEIKMYMYKVRLYMIGIKREIVCDTSREIVVILENQDPTCFCFFSSLKKNNNHSAHHLRFSLGYLFQKSSCTVCPVMFLE